MKMLSIEGIFCFEKYPKPMNSTCFSHSLKIRTFAFLFFCEMALYLFIDKMNTETLIIEMNLPQQEFRLYEVTGIEPKSKKIQAQLRLEFIYFGLLKKFLKKEIRTPLSNGEMVYISSGGFVFRKPIVKINQQTLKRKRIKKSQLIFS